MNQDTHARAQELMAAARVEGISTAEQAWLAEHLENCAACAQAAAQTERAIQALRWVAVSADPAMVRATQQRVRERAYELAGRRARMLPIAISCGMAAVLGLGTVVWLWRGFAWMGELWGLPAVAWQAGFVWAWFLPTVVAAALLFWLRTPAIDGNRKTMQWSPARRGRQGGE